MNSPYMCLDRSCKPSNHLHEIPDRARSRSARICAVPPPVLAAESELVALLDAAAAAAAFSAAVGLASRPPSRAA